MSAPGLRKTAMAIAALSLFSGLALSHDSVRGYLSFTAARLRGGYTLAERLDQYGPRVSTRLRGAFERAGLVYPPHELAYLSFKDTRVLEVYARASSAQPWRFIKAYPVLGASGRLGPKLAEGDNQVPEGRYRAEYLNPNSRFHLSIRLDYPNEFDKRMARQDGRTRLGSDIMIHGSSASIGCLAMGDDAAEDLFVLAGLVSKERVQVLISPTDFRLDHRAVPPDNPAWVKTLYGDLQSALESFPSRTAHPKAPS